MTFQARTKALFALAVLVSGAVFYVIKNSQDQGPILEGVGDFIFPGLESQLETVDQIVLFGPEGVTTLMLIDGVWGRRRARKFPGPAGFG